MNSLVAGLHMAILSNRSDVGKTRARSGANPTNMRRWRRVLIKSRWRRANSDQNDDIDALWRKRGELAKGIVEAAAPTIHDLVLKMAMTTSLLSEGEVGVGLTPQSLEECDRALAQEGDGEQCLKASGAGALGIMPAGPDARLPRSRRDGIFRARKPEDRTTLCDGFSLATAWDELHESVWSVARYETMTAVGLRAKGKMFRDLLAFVSAMEGLFALQDSYLRDFDHLAYRRLHGIDSPMPRRSVG